MGMDTWAAPAIVRRLCVFLACGSGCGLALKLALRIEPFEYKPAGVAEQLVHTYGAEKNTRVVKIPLNPLALAPWTLHCWTILQRCRVLECSIVK